jgi:ribosomal protein S18 acetylase RimI-like enzyme
LHLIPFVDEHLPAAAELLALRHRAHRAAAPLLPARFAEPAAALAALEAAWRKAGTTGVAAFAGERLAGFMLGTAKDDALRGRHAWIPLAGHGLAPDAEAGLGQDLYAALAARWAGAGYFNHFVLVPATDRAALDAWFGLGFGQEQVHAFLPLGSGAGNHASGAPAPGTPAPAGVEIRRASPDDLASLLDVADLISTHQALSPCFAAFLPEARLDWPEGWAELLADPKTDVWLALEAGRVLSFQAYVPAEPSDSNLLEPEGCVLLEVAATRPEARGRRLNRLLTTHGLAAAEAAGYTCCLTDWRATNLLSSRFWPRQGFKPAVCRLSRRIDPRIAWAQG